MPNTGARSATVLAPTCAAGTAPSSHQKCKAHLHNHGTRRAGGPVTLLVTTADECNLQPHRTRRSSSPPPQALASPSQRTPPTW